MTELLSILAGLAGAVVVGVITIAAGSRSSKTLFLWGLHKEFNGEQMQKSRVASDKIFEKHPVERFDELYEKLPGEDSIHIWNLIGFYQRLALAIEHNHIDKSLVPKMFGPTFVWWYVVVFDHSLVPLDENVWDGCREIKWLYRWFSGHRGYEVWKAVADKDLKLRQTPTRASATAR
jgi:hypothetical protein